MRTILVTGATGRLGTALLDAFPRDGLTVRAMSRRPRSSAGAEWRTADLTTGEGVAPAVAGADTIVHLASAPYKGRYTGRVELDGTRRLLAAARECGVRHLVYLSIVGVDRVPWGYFRTKVMAEELVRQGGVPWTIMRVTQFHEFVDQALRGMARLPFLLADPGITAQPVDVRDVAGALLSLVADGPAGEIREYGGPEVLDVDTTLGAWRRARGVRRPVLRVRLPGRLGRAFRAGHLTTGARPSGTITWADYLAGSGGAGRGHGGR
ncbi:NAD(P)H-binding protein [Spongiactinospora sp. TRM90649]|uniref:SDR family oxidoreductase n=1 Tax=Spongiactinospora sp. TRM90649 TaxID=3031114 RepID=UPI0023F74A19|nr:NAD(P)H-binding protein [Spongiactinospora sp. TRM90649]MDF5752016.1 NAD(P)H-binding protein [Spongiactinospora sp. TRM90649]